MSRPSLDDYVDVAERIIAFKEKHPDGSLQTIDWQVVQVGDKTFIVYRAAAYRTADDVRPGHGTAWEPFPGPTPYTKDSELMNAETAAWGRAIVALGVPANRKIASKQEVKARAGGKQEPLASKTDVDAMAFAGDGLSVPQIKTVLAGCGLADVNSYAQVPHAKVGAVTQALKTAKRTA